MRCFGTECEYLLAELCKETRQVKLMPCAPQLLQLIPDPSVPSSGSYTFMPEFASYMVEGTPREPWSLHADFGPQVQDWFLGATRQIRAGLMKMDMKHVFPFTLTSFPLLGVPDSVCEYSSYIAGPCSIMESEFCDDILVNPHPRFGTLARNIRARRGKKVHITAPRLIPQVNETPGSVRLAVPPSSAIPSKRASIDATLHPCHTKIPATKYDFRAEADRMLSSLFISSRDDVGSAELRSHIDRVVASSDVRMVDDAPVPESRDSNSIYMDAMVFGMGMCCLQATFSCLDEEEARYLYDQLAVLSPLFLALTAATAAYKGVLSQHTTRWRVLSQSVDDRRDEEHAVVPFSRFSTVSLFISKEPLLLNNYERLNDVRVPSRPDVYDACVFAGLDTVIARHFSAVLARDPLVAFEENLDEVDIDTTDSHFETFQSTNWNTVRFKPPSNTGKSYKIPWRVEFRCCESQLSDIDSSRMIIVIVLMVKLMLKERWMLYIPMSLVHENMEASDSQDAVTKHKFHFATNTTGESLDVGKFTLYEIFFGNQHLGLFRRCVEQLHRDMESGIISKESFKIYMESLELVENRMRGTLATNAQEIRDFALKHPEYQGDGRLPHSIVYDLMAKLVHKN